MHISNWSVDTLFQSANSLFNLGGWLYSDEVEPIFEPMTTNTTSIDDILPGIQAYYGPNLPIDILFDLITIGDFITKADNETVTLSGDLNMKWYVHIDDVTQELAADITLKNVVYEGSIVIDNMVTHLRIDKINIGSIH